MRAVIVASMVLLSLFTAQAQRSPFTGAVVRPPDSTGHYRLVISGHFHGSSGGRSGYPAATLLANLDTLVALAPNVLLSTGDLFLDAEADLPRYRKALFQRLPVPLFNAPGNHDAGKAYVQAFGQALQVITLGSDHIVLLDTERDDGSVKGDQLDTLKAVLARATSRVFIVSHRPIWSEQDTVYGPLFEGNTRSLLPTNYCAEVEPLLLNAAAHAEVYWISGSMAGRAPSSFFFQPHRPGLTFIQSAIRDLPRDAVLVADVGPGGVRWSGVSLTGRPVEDPRTCDAAWWRKRMGRPEPFNWRVLPYIVKTTVTTVEFLSGLAAGILMTLLLVLLVRRLRRA
jgi:hypothetical protein